MDACNASFQIHLQVDPQNFACAYNLAQMVTAPVLAAAVNSPLLLGRRLWQETRVGLFPHPNATRTNAQPARRPPPRVGLGGGWRTQSPLEPFRPQNAHFAV